MLFTPYPHIQSVNYTHALVRIEKHSRKQCNEWQPETNNCILKPKQCKKGADFGRKVTILCTYLNLKSFQKLWIRRYSNIYVQYTCLNLECFSIFTCSNVQAHCRQFVPDDLKYCAVILLQSNIMTTMYFVLYIKVQSACTNYSYGEVIKRTGTRNVIEGTRRMELARSRK